MTVRLLALVALWMLFGSGCLKSEQETAIASGADKLTKADALAALADHTLIGVIPHLNINFSLYYAPGGRLLGAITGAMKGRDRGTWRVQDDGQVCLRWANWEESNEKCRELWRQGDEYKVFEDKAGVTASIATSKPGNVQKLELRSDLEILQEKETLKPMTAQALRIMLPGNTTSGPAPAMKGAEQHTYYEKGNRVTIHAPTEYIKDKGTYRITDEGKVCATFSYLKGSNESCESWFESDKGYRVFDAYGSLALVAKVREGNPENLGQAQ